MKSLTKFEHYGDVACCDERQKALPFETANLVFSSFATGKTVLANVGRLSDTKRLDLNFDGNKFYFCQVKNKFLYFA